MTERRGFFRLSSSSVEAVVSSRAAALRLLRVEGEHLVEPTEWSPLEPGMSGAVLAPWPNRVASARWTHDGREQRLAVTEPGLGHALHGLLTRTDFVPTPGAPGEVRLVARVDGERGYPFTLAVEVRYALLPGGIRVDIVTANEGTETAPVAVGAHPYLRVGDWPSSSLRVQLDADHAAELDEAHLPRRRLAVEGTPWDLRTPQPLSRAPGHATYEWCGRRRRLVHALEAPDGHRVELHADPDLRWTQLYLAPMLATDAADRPGVAIEPMSAPPNGLQTGTGMRMLRAGQNWRTGFRIVSAQAESLAR